VFYKIKVGKLSLDEYMDLDDVKIQKEIFDYQTKSKDDILRLLIECFRARSGYEKCDILNNSPLEIYDFLAEYDRKTGLNHEKQNGLIFAAKSFYAYGKNSIDSINQILIAKRNGIITPYQNVSSIFKKEETNQYWNKTKAILYYNKRILEREWAEKKIEFHMPDFVDLLDDYSIYNHMEVARKFWCSEQEFNKLLTYLCEMEKLSSEESVKNYIIIENTGETGYEDVYYDTKNFSLFKEKCAFRCRRSGSTEIYSVKSAKKEEEYHNSGYFIRSEFTKEKAGARENKTIKDNHIEEYLRGMFLEGELINYKSDQVFPVISIALKRNSFLVARKTSSEKAQFSCVIHFDQVVCRNLLNPQVNKKRGWQIEIELENKEPLYHVELVRLSELLIQQSGFRYKKSRASKYEFALRILQMI